MDLSVCVCGDCVSGCGIGCVQFVVQDQQHVLATHFGPIGIRCSGLVGSCVYEWLCVVGNVGVRAPKVAVCGRECAGV